MKKKLDLVAPIKNNRIPCHKIWQEPWITTGLSRSMNKCTQLYKKSIKCSATPTDNVKYKTYRNALTKIKRKAKEDYYNKRCYDLKSNTKKLWQLINHIINKTNDKNCIIDYIKVNNIEYHDTRDIANCFGKYYSSMGFNLAQSINPKNPRNLSLQDYLSKIAPNPHSMYLHLISSIEIKKLYKKNSHLRIAQVMIT